VRSLNHHGWREWAREADHRDEDPKAELARLHAKLARLADGQANASELWKVVEQIREVRARM
jgi:hypothetical protein